MAKSFPLFNITNCISMAQAKNMCQETPAPSEVPSTYCLGMSWCWYHYLLFEGFWASAPKTKTLEQKKAKVADI